MAFEGDVNAGQGGAVLAAEGQGVEALVVEVEVRVAFELGARRPTSDTIWLARRPMHALDGAFPELSNYDA